MKLYHIANKLKITIKLNLKYVFVGKTNFANWKFHMVSYYLAKFLSYLKILIFAYNLSSKVLIVELFSAL